MNSLFTVKNLTGGPETIYPRVLQAAEMLFPIIYIFLSCSLPFEHDLSSFCAIAQLALTIGFVRYPRSTGCSASVSLLYAVLRPIVLSIRLGREHSFLYYSTHVTLYSILLDQSSRMKALHMQCNSFVVRTRARESFPSSVSCFRSRRSSHEPEPDGLRQAVLWISKNSCH